MGELHFDVLIMTALKDELDAVLELTVDSKGRGAWTSARDRSGLPYSWREVQNSQQETLRVAAAWSGDMGETAAATRAMGLIQELDPACLAMCGICAGRRGKVFLGDVIVADRVFSYDHGKLIAGTHESGAGFFHDITTYNLDLAWKMDATFFAEEFTKNPRLERVRPLSLEAQQRWILRTLEAHERAAAPSLLEHPDRKSRAPDLAACIQVLRKREFIEAAIGRFQLTEKGRAQAIEGRLIDPDGQQSDAPFRVHVAPIATGKVVQEDPQLFDSLSRHVRQVLGAEMEATAIGLVAEQLGRRLLIAKAVSDHADHDKDDAYRSFACHASAAFLLAFLQKHLRPQRSLTPLFTPSPTPSPPQRDRRQNEFLARVEQLCALRYPPGTQIKRVDGPASIGEFLELTVSEGGFIQVFPVAAIDQPMTGELLAAFLEGVHAGYRRRDPTVISTLVHAGPTASEELSRQARAQQVRLSSFGEYLVLFDFSAYLKWQSARLENDQVYPPSLYVEQRGRVSVGGGEELHTEDVLKTLTEILDSPHPRFALVLGDFGTGKTFLLHELARRLATQQHALVPVLIEMRSLQKHRSLKALIAQHFAAADLGRLEPDKFLSMLKSGRIALLFDGFDELALRVTYDQVMEHFNTLIEAVQGEAKVVITSRTQHFMTHQQVKRELGERAAALPGYRFIELARFSDKQVWRYLAMKLGSAAAADERMEILRDVHLLGLAENPRMLSFIVDLEEGALRDARARAGKITSAKLYEILIKRWIHGEYRRVNPSGAPKGLDELQILRGATELAMLLWERTDRSVDVMELPPGLFEAVNAGGEQPLGPEVIRHQLGSGSLLVRDAEGRFSFIHQSVMEWLVADAAAQAVRQGGDAGVLGRRELSDLMADFFITLARPEAARRWAEAKASSAESDVIRNSALRVLRRLPKTEAEPGASQGMRLARNLEKSDLRGQDLSEADLRHANLAGANLSGATLVRANLVEARLSQANLKRANLEKAVLRGANLAGADLSNARLLGADLRGAQLQGASLHAAKLVGARLDSLEGLRLFGAALPSPADLVPTLGLASAVRAVAFSPTGEFLATAHVGGMVHLWDAETGHALRVFEGHTDCVTSLAFSPDGKLLATSSEDGNIILWSVEYVLRLHTLSGHRGSVLSVAFSPDGKWLASGSDDQTVILWSVESARPLRTLQGHGGIVRTVAFSPDGRMLASGSDDRSLILWSVVQGRALKPLQKHRGFILSVAFSPDGKWLASGSDDQSVILWSVEQAKPLRTLQGHGAIVRSVAFSPDGRTLASSADDRSVILWSIRQASALHSLKSHTGPVRGVAFSPDGKWLASGSDDQSAILWNVEQAKPLRTLQGQAGSVRSVTFSLNGKVQAMGFTDGSVLLWSVEQARLLRVLQAHTGAVLSLAFSPDGRTLASGAEGGAIILWSVEQGQPLGTLQGHREAIVSMAFSPDGQTLASGAADETLIFWSVEQARPLRTRQVHRGSILSVAFSPDGKMLASTGAEDRTIILWSVEQATALRTIRGHTSPVRNVTFSPDGRTLAASSEDQTLILWSVEQPRLLRTFQTHRGFIQRMAFSPDGKLLASGSDSGALTLWNVEQATPLRTFQGHRGGILSVAFSPGGTSLSSASDDGTVRFWELATGRQLATFLGGLDGWVAFRPDGRFKSGGDVSGIFWHASGLCRFEPGELDPYLPAPLRLTDREPFFLMD
jgi:WD40 repeat protein/nucleoside phosphorylase